MRPDCDEVVDLPDWEWADLDGKRLVWAAEGKLHAARLGRTGIGFQRILRDFNGMGFEPLRAPY